MHVAAHSAIEIDRSDSLFCYFGFKVAFSSSISRGSESVAFSVIDIVLFKEEKRTK